MLNHAVSPLLISALLDQMKAHPFSLCIDGSNDSGLEKMNLITVRIYDLSASKVVTRFLDMCACSSGTAEALYSALDGKLVELLGTDNPWVRCTSLGVNTSVNIGIRNSLKSRIIKRTDAIYFNGCPCHTIHNAAQKAG